MNSLIVIVFSFFVVNQSLIAQPHKRENNLTESNDSGYIHMNVVKDKIIIPVEINNTIYQFLVDTGGIFEISESLQNTFNFTQLDSTTIVDINKIETEIKTVNVPEILIGQWKFKNKKAIVSGLPSQYPYSCFKLDGMIGRDFFDQIALQFDYHGQVFRMTKNPEKLKTNKKHKTKMKLSSRGLPKIKLNINGKNKYIEFDSGSGDLYSPKTNDIIKLLKKNKQSNKTQNILSFYGKFSFGITMDNIKATNRYAQRIEKFTIANTTFGPFYSQFSKVSAPRIGAGILKHAKVTLDYKNGWFFYEPYKSNKSNKPNEHSHKNEKVNIAPFATYGFAVAIDDHEYKIKWVLKNSKAYKNGMRAGQSLVSINGQPTIQIENDCHGYLNGYAFEKDNNISVKFINEENIKQSVSLERIFFQ